MKASVDADRLLAGLQAVSAAAASRTTKPVLSSVKVVATDGALTLTAYDMEIGSRYEVGVNATYRAGSCLLPPGEAVKILRECEGPVELSAGEDKVVLAWPGARFEMPYLDPLEFPDLPDGAEGGRTFEVPAADLRRLIGRTAFAADKRDTTAKFALAGVLFDVTADGHLELVGTDTKRLAVASRPAQNVGGEAVKPAVVPLKAVQMVKGLTGDEGIVYVTLRANDALFRAGSGTVYTALVQGRFPPYATIVAKTREEAVHRIQLPREAFLAAVRQAAVMVDAESSRLDVTIDMSGVGLKVRGATKGSSEVRMELPEPWADEGDDIRIEIAFDPAYLSEFLRACDEDAVVLRVSTGQRAALFEAGADTTMLVMPLTG